MIRRFLAAIAVCAPGLAGATIQAAADEVLTDDERALAQDGHYRRLFNFHLLHLEFERANSIKQIFPHADGKVLCPVLFCRQFFPVELLTEEERDLKDRVNCAGAHAEVLSSD